MDLLIRSVEDGKIVEAEVEESCGVGAVKEQIAESLDHRQNELTLLYKGRKISDDTELDSCAVEDNDLLILEKRGDAYIDPGLGAVEEGREWLRQNIVASGTNLELRDYRVKGGEEKEMIFRLEDESAKLVVSEGKIDDYGLVSSVDT